MRQWAFEQVGEVDAAVSTVAAQLGVAWWTVMDQVIDRGSPLIDGPTRLSPTQGPVTAVGVDETAYLRANVTRSTTFATAIADRPRAGPRGCSTSLKAAPAPCWPARSPTNRGHGARR